MNHQTPLQSTRAHYHQQSKRWCVDKSDLLFNWQSSFHSHGQIQICEGYQPNSTHFLKFSSAFKIVSRHPNNMAKHQDVTHHGKDNEVTFKEKSFSRREGREGGAKRATRGLKW